MRLLPLGGAARLVLEAEGHRVAVDEARVDHVVPGEARGGAVTDAVTDGVTESVTEVAGACSRTTTPHGDGVNVHSTRLCGEGAPPRLVG